MIYYFFLPKQDLPPFKNLPTWKDIGKYPNLFLSPALNWTWRTYYHLLQSGFPCKLVDFLPLEGIIFSASCNLPILFKPNAKQFIISCVADSPPLFFAQCQVFQSASQAALWQSNYIFPHVTFSPHWPQPGLLKRSLERGNSFINLSYFGASNQLDLSLQTRDTINKFKKIGVTLNYNFQNYYDYSNTDCVFAIRKFNQNIVLHKPASKLINSWLAGVPAILGKESAYQELRTSKFDYIEVDSINEMINATIELKNDKLLRDAMFQNSIEKSEEFTIESLTSRWASFLFDEIPALYDSWRSLSWIARSHFYNKQFTKRANISLKHKVKHLKYF